MSGKPGCGRTALKQARRDPDDKVKATLLELKCPIRDLSELDKPVNLSTHGNARSRGLKTSPVAHPTLKGMAWQRTDKQAGNIQCPQKALIVTFTA